MTTPDRAPAAVTARCPLCSAIAQGSVPPGGEVITCTSCERPIRVDRPIAATDDSLDRSLRETALPVLVDFHADWCAPCHMMAPVLDELAWERRGETLVLKVDTDRNPRMAEQFGIRGIPTIILFRGGVEEARNVGATSKGRLEELLATPSRAKEAS